MVDLIFIFLFMTFGVTSLDRVREFQRGYANNKAKVVIGFKKEYSTIDGAFILHALTSIMRKRNKTLYAVFVDLRKAFPSIS